MPLLDELLSDALDEVWDGATEELKLVVTNIKQAKNTLDKALKAAKKKKSKEGDTTDAANLRISVAEAIRQLNVAIEKLEDFIEPMEDEEDDDEGEDFKKKKPSK